MWRLPGDANSARTGLSDRLSPGDISKLSQSNEIAFRVKIKDGEMPPNNQRYWRGPVFWWSDGKDWRTGFNRFETPKAMQFSGEPVEQIITLEPHNQTWLFALELPEAPPAAIRHSRITHDYQLQTRIPVTERVRYRVVSYPSYYAADLDRAQRGIALRLPKNKHYRTKALAAQWQAEIGDPEQIVARALRYFSDEPFEYTLEPPLLVDDPVDEFLFDTQSGFCEHYAAAFTTLMRAAEIPARIVTGYQGAEINPLGNYWIVRQRDAHAWSEVWLEGQGWVRIDPTAAVSPSRVEQGIETALPGSMTQSAALNWTRNQPYLRDAVEQMLTVWDAVNNNWNEWVLGYGPELQHALLDYLGMPTTYQAMVTILVIVTGGILFVIILWLVRSHRREFTDPAQRAYLRFCKKLARQGLKPYRTEAPHAFGIRAGRRFPRLRESIQNIVSLYLAIRYNNQQHKLVELKQAVRRLQV